MSMELNGFTSNLEASYSYHNYVLTFILISLFLPCSLLAEQNRCEVLYKLSFSDAKIINAELIPTGEHSLPDGTIFLAPAFCKVEGQSHPTTDSDIKFEIWMPVSGWTGRYYQVGFGGFSGGIYYPELKRMLLMGNAVAATNDGHEDSVISANWALGHPEKLVDWGYRGMKATRNIAKSVIEAFYKKAPNYSYFTGCSGGGRYGLVAAQRYPEDWDGIISGAPAANLTGLFTNFANIQHTLNSKKATYIAPNKLPAIQDAAISSCDRKANVINGIATDPRHCNFKPEILKCRNKENNQCLTSLQIDSVKRIVEGIDEPEKLAGFEPTLAKSWYSKSWGYMISSNPKEIIQLQMSQSFFSNIIYENQEWTLEDFDTEHAYKSIRNKMVLGQPVRKILNATSTDLNALRRRKGKILMYVGWGDSAVPPRSVINYYNSVQEAMGVEKTQEFFKLFMVPGMGHCWGGEVPSSFGQPYRPPGVLDNREDNIIRTLEDWVEKDIVPRKIIATEYVNDNPKEGVVSTNLLCPYPEVAVYEGSGPFNQADSFSCSLVSEAEN